MHIAACMSVAQNITNCINHDQTWLFDLLHIQGQSYDWCYSHIIQNCAHVQGQAKTRKNFRFDSNSAYIIDKLTGLQCFYLFYSTSNLKTLSFISGHASRCSISSSNLSSSTEHPNTPYCHRIAHSISVFSDLQLCSAISWILRSDAQITSAQWGRTWYLRAE